MRILLPLLIFFLASLSGATKDTECTARHSALCTPSAGTEHTASIAALCAKPVVKDTEQTASLAAVSATSQAPMNSTPFMKFVLGETSSPHPLMSTSASSSDVNASINAAIAESELGISVEEDLQQSRKKAKYEIDADKARDFLKRYKFGHKPHRISSMPNAEVVRTLLIREYLALVLRVPDASNVGKQLQECYSGEERYSVVQHCVGNKATSTLTTRVVPIRAYSSFVDTVVAGMDLDQYEHDPSLEYGGWPPNEIMAYRYVQQAKSLTAARSFLESIGFLIGTFGFNLFSVISERMRGFASIKIGQLGPIRKAAVAVDILIAKLEIIVCSTTFPPRIRLGAGNDLLKLMTRTRVSDWRFRSFTDLGTTDPMRILVIVDRVKTSKASDRQELALVGPVVSCTGLDWLGEYKTLRTEENISLDDDWPLLPSWNEKEGWVKQEASIREVNRLVKEVVATAQEDTTRMTSHSFRRTGATAAARDGMTPQEQSVLLDHKTATSRATSAYDQSRLEGVMPRYEKALVNIYGKLNGGSKWSQDRIEQVESDMLTNFEQDKWSNPECDEKSSSEGEVPLEPDVGNDDDSMPDLVSFDGSEKAEVADHGEGEVPADDKPHAMMKANPKSIGKSSVTPVPQEEVEAADTDEEVLAKQDVDYGDPWLQSPGRPRPILWASLHSLRR